MRKHSLTFVVLVLIPLLLNAGDAGNMHPYILFSPLLVE